jgi:DNA polymerase
MDNLAKATTGADLVAALDWWREAGVDCDFHDAPADWLEAAKQPEPRGRTGATLAPAPGAGPVERGSRQRADAPIAAAPTAPAIDLSALPQDISAFADWWLAEPTLDQGRTAGRVPPRGIANAELMIIVPEPEREDSERLLSGQQGRLLDAMLAAMGIALENTYVASALPRHLPMADWAEIAAQGFGEVLARHVALASPRRLIAFGQNVLPLLGNDPANSPAVSRTFNHEGLTIPLLTGRSLAALLERPRWKAGLWQGWLDWTA